MNVADLLVALSIEACQLLPSRSAQCLLKVAMEALPTLSSLVGDPVTCIKALCLISGLVFSVE